MRTEQDIIEGSESAIGVLKRIQNASLPFAAVGVIGLIAALVSDRHAFFTSYFFGYFFWLGLTLGSTTLTYLHHTVRGKWGIALLRVFEAGNKNLPLMAGLFIPILYGVWTGQIYPWTDAAAVAKSVPMAHRAWFMNPTGFTIRFLLYFAFWIITTRILNRSAEEQDKTRDEGLAEWRKSFAPPIGVAHVVLLTFAYTDWLMSLMPSWFSTMYGVIFMINGILSTFALGIIVMTGLYKYRPYSQAITPVITRDVGNMTLGFTMFWGYTNLSQFLIIWSGNLPEEISFYGNRFFGPLVLMGAFIVVGQFFMPFLALLSGRTKRTISVLRQVAIWILFVRIVDIFWQVTPFFRIGMSLSDMPAYLLDIAAWAGIGGIWLYAFLGTMASRTLLPAHDQRLQEAAAEAHAHA